MQAAELCEKKTPPAGSPSDGRNSPFVVEMCSIRKTFLDVTASSDVNFTLREGEICALLGENGAANDSHEHPLRILCRGRRRDPHTGAKKVSFSSPGDAIARGIGMVHQHFTLVPSQTVLENVVVGKLQRTVFS